MKAAHYVKRLGAFKANCDTQLYATSDCKEFYEAAQSSVAWILVRDDCTFVTCYLELNYTVDHLFGQVSGEFVDTSPIPLWTIVPRKWGKFFLRNVEYSPSEMALWEKISYFYWT